MFGKEKKGGNKRIRTVVKCQFGKSARFQLLQSPNLETGFASYITSRAKIRQLIVRVVKKFTLLHALHCPKNSVEAYKYHESLDCLKY